MSIFKEFCIFEDIYCKKCNMFNKNNFILFFATPSS